MDKKEINAWDRLRPTKRRLIQLYAALLYNANIKGFIRGDIYTGPLKNLCVPGLNCYSCPGAVGACPLGALQNALASSGARAPLYVPGILMLFGLTLGRTVCGWLCPMGMIQELIHKLPVPKIGKNSVTRILSRFKYVILALFAVGIPLFYSIRHLPVPGFCKYICPAGTLEGAAALLVHPANADKLSLLGKLFTWKFMILVIICLACAFLYRPFCRFLCPLGAIYGLFAKLSVLGVRVEPSKCTGCGKCVRSCRMDIRHVGDHECIHCGECVDVCRENAIIWHAGPAVIRTSQASPEKKRKSGMRKIAAGLGAFILLGGVIWYVNRDTGESANGTAAVAKEGMQCPDFSVELYESGRSALQDNSGKDLREDPSEVRRFAPGDHLGKPVVINFWATWCAPCVTELPYFQKLQDDYGDRIAVAAIHSGMIVDDVQKFMEREGLTILCGQDPDGSVFKALGGSVMLPVTVILDGEGRIVCSRTGAVTYQFLKEQVDQLLAQEEAANEPASDQTQGSSYADSFNRKEYRDAYGMSVPAMEAESGEEQKIAYSILVTGENGEGIEGVMLQACDDSTCLALMTDADGKAGFEAQPFAWQIHVLGVPDGFEKPEDEFPADNKGTEWNIVLKKDNS